jgi:hypothetical protein
LYVQVTKINHQLKEQNAKLEEELAVWTTGTLIFCGRAGFSMR